MSNNESVRLFARAQRVIPGGVNSPVRSFAAVGGTPRFFVRGSGAHVWDEDGRRYVDLVQSWGPLPLGHAHPAVVAAATAALERGSTFGAPTRAEVELAEVIVDALPSIERVRLVSSGTEAAMSTVRLARGATGRAKILKFEGHYHGHADSLLVAAGSGVATLGLPGSPGVTAASVADTVTVPWNDVGAVTAAVDELGQDLAAILCEPVPANMNLVPPVEGFLRHLRAEGDRCGALLVFDEVITGFRLARGGAQAAYDVVPDLTILGKVLGGGFPLAAFGGRADVMDELAPAGPVYQAGTLSGNPVAVAAGLAQLSLLDAGAYAALTEIAAQLVEDLARVLRLAGVPTVVRRVRTLAGVVFADAPPMRYDEVATADHARYAAFFHGMLERGVYLAPSGYEVIFPCTALDAADLDLVRTAAEDVAEHL